jgi:hypothetical protein
MWKLLNILILPLITAAPLTNPKRQIPTCPTYMVIEAPGLGDYDGYWTGPTTAGILAGLPGGERYLLKTREPGDDGPNSIPLDIVVNATLGSLEIVETVATNTALCPEIKFVVFGYSYGSIEVALALNNPAMLRLPVAAVIIYGKYVFSICACLSFESLIYCIAASGMLAVSRTGEPLQRVIQSVQVTHQ